MTNHTPNFAIPGLMEIRSPAAARAAIRFAVNLVARLGEGIVADVVVPAEDGTLRDLSGYEVTVAVWYGGNDDPRMDFLEAEITNTDPASSPPVTYDPGQRYFMGEDGQEVKLEIDPTSWRVRLTGAVADLDKLCDRFARWEMKATPPSGSDAPVSYLYGYFDIDRTAFDTEG